MNRGYVSRNRRATTIQSIQSMAIASGEVLISMVGMLLLAIPAGAQVTTTLTSPITSPSTPPKVRLIEWNLPAQADATPGAVVVDTLGHDANRMWFVTCTADPHLYRMEFPKSFMKGSRNGRRGSSAAHDGRNQKGPRVARPPVHLHTNDLERYGGGGRARRYGSNKMQRHELPDDDLPGPDAHSGLMSLTWPSTMGTTCSRRYAGISIPHRATCSGSPRHQQRHRHALERARPARERAGMASSRKISPRILLVSPESPFTRPNRR